MAPGCWIQAAHGSYSRVAPTDTSGDIRGRSPQGTSYASNLIELKGGRNINEADAELTRWTLTAIFGGLEHMARENIELRGYKIKKGTILEGNIWVLMHDPALYPDPYTFNLNAT
ncbi:hypothetical protein B0J17DRAFT_720577 [Rhizoctonia solani]|nr:hypothetical protein B0J17DRAFT_720577 [Rhizoctonia solani]